MFAIKPHHGGISVPNLDESIDWYRLMLGFELESRAFISQIPAEIAFIRCGDYRIELFQLDQAHPLPADRREPHLDLKTHGHKHLCFAVQDAPAAFAVLRGKGANIVFENVIDGTPMGFLRDNSGNLLELIQCPALWSAQGEHR
ncbi:MAG: VOC family protein [Pseudomonas sp.]|uniref:VOC family protein n=1 Tax=Pseudomonas ogarae (strain DSM 112162 / CECT 30235 / F113) TaxID=1114970 RepID=A0ABM6QUP1_PSEO1|nr:MULTISPECIES: VOC family protein [Pseudomonas]AEV60859.1 Glyoxalase/bleomycin resistance protein/dioxygenase [Pseudomonas ogarae]AUO44733.1 VOC family protein [Pseudomonas ogarae]MBL1308782.1 VOC family protein [Pseudomonas sp.]